MGDPNSWLREGMEAPWTGPEPLSDNIWLPAKLGSFLRV